MDSGGMASISKPPLRAGKITHAKVHLGEGQAGAPPPARCSRVAKTRQQRAAGAAKSSPATAPPARRSGLLQPSSAFNNLSCSSESPLVEQRFCELDGCPTRFRLLGNRQSARVPPYFLASHSRIELAQKALSRERAPTALLSSSRAAVKSCICWKISAR